MWALPWRAQGKKMASDFAPHDLTSYVSHSPYFPNASSFESNFGGFPPWKAFDDLSGAGAWQGIGGGVDWLSLDTGFGRAYTLDSYSISAGGTRAPKNWTFQGSNDNLAWTTLDTRTNITSWNPTSATLNFVTNSTTPYRYYRLNITANNGDGTYDSLGDVYLFGTFVDPDLVGFGPHNMTGASTPSPFVIANSSNFDANSFASRAFDALISTTNEAYWIGTGGGVDWVSLDLGSGNSKRLGRYGVWPLEHITAPARTPKNWTIEGSNNNTTWTVLDTRTNQTSWSSNVPKLFTLATVGIAYRYFRINITANNGDATYTEIGQLSFFEGFGGGGAANFVIT
jgi:hypothetical protein